MLRVLALILTTLLVTPLARAAPNSLQAGIMAYDNLEYARSRMLLERALRGQLSDSDKKTARKILAFDYVALGQNQQAEENFEQLLKLDPDFSLDRTVSPKIRDVFETVQKRLAPPPMTVTPEEAGHIEAPPVAEIPTIARPDKPRDGEAVTLSLAYPKATKAILYHRKSGAMSYERIVATAKAGKFSATVPSKQVGKLGLDYYWTLTDAEGTQIATTASEDNPQRLFVDARKVPVYKRAWFWGVIGGVLVAGGVAGGVVAATTSSVAADAPATITVMPH